jgi:DNA-binding transcriptional ArsR family regulator
MIGVRPEGGGGPRGAHERPDSGERPGRGAATGSTVEVIFEVLSNRRRRHVLHYLKQIPGPVTMRDLSEQLTAWETGKDRAAIRPAERKRVYTALHQNHLPRMDRAGVLEYDRDRGTVVLTDEFDAYDVYLEVGSGWSPSWGLYYAGLGIATAGLLAASTQGLAAFSAVSVGAWSGLSAIAVAASGVAQLLLGDRPRVGVDRFQRVVGGDGSPEIEAPPVEDLDRP